MFAQKGGLAMSKCAFIYFMMFSFVSIDCWPNTIGILRLSIRSICSSEEAVPKRMNHRGNPSKEAEHDRTANKRTNKNESEGNNNTFCITNWEIF